jgi:hypothetical protein
MRVNPAQKNTILTKYSVLKHLSLNLKFIFNFRSRHNKPKQRKEFLHQNMNSSPLNIGLYQHQKSSSEMNNNNNNNNNNSSNNALHSPPLSTNNKSPNLPSQHSQQQDSLNKTSVSPSSSNSSTLSALSSAAAAAAAAQQATSSQTSSSCGMPRPAVLSLENAPVHIDAGGILYTSSLATLTRHRDSLISKMFNGSVPIVLDSLKQHYFIDRDGKLFRHVLNFMRTGRVSLPSGFDDFEALFAEAKYYELSEMVRQLESILDSRRKTDSTQSQPSSTRKLAKTLRFNPYGSYSSSVSNSTRLDQSLVSSSTMVSRTAGILANKNLPSSSSGACSDESVEEMPPAEEEPKTGTSSSADEVAQTAQAPSPPPPPQSLAQPSKVKILIVNQIETKLYVSGESQVIRGVLPELSLPNSTAATPADSASTYLSKLSLSEQAELSELHLVELMERIYEQEFTLEACYALPMDGAAAAAATEASTQYIFVNKQ